MVLNVLEMSLNSTLLLSAVFQDVFCYFSEKPAQPLPPEVVGYGEDGVNVTFMEPLPKTLRKFGGKMDEEPWELRPVGGFEMENLGVGGYPERFYVVYRRHNSNDELKKTKMRQMWGPRDQTWIVIEKLQKDTVYEFATVPVNSLGEGPRSKWVNGLTGGIVRKYCFALMVIDDGSMM